MRFLTHLARGLQLRCPRCGTGGMFCGWFRMQQQCQLCGLKYQREGGYFLGSIYFNYGLTSLLLVVAYFTLYFGALLPPQGILALLGAFIAVFPLWFFRYARSLWLNFDYYFDPHSFQDDPPA